MLVVVLVQGSRVFAVADQPVYRWEVLALCQLLIQAPENLPEVRKVNQLSKSEVN